MFAEARPGMAGMGDSGGKASFGAILVDSEYLRVDIGL